MWKTIKEQPEKTFLIQIWNYYKPIIRGVAGTERWDDMAIP
jgi:hypothetical protein